LGYLGISPRICRNNILSNILDSLPTHKY
jgi:hypothetical protein